MALLFMLQLQARLRALYMTATCYRQLATSTLLSWLRLPQDNQGEQLLFVLLQRSKSAGCAGAAVALQKLGSNTAGEDGGHMPKTTFFRQ